MISLKAVFGFTFQSLINTTMGKLIQKVPLDETRALYLIRFNPKTMKLTYRSSMRPNHLVTEEITIIKDLVHTFDYFFHVSFLARLLPDTTKAIK
jgi:hypothetical protein